MKDKKYPIIKKIKIEDSPFISYLKKNKIQTSIQ